MAPRAPDATQVSQAKAAALIVLALLVGFWIGYLYRGQQTTPVSALHSPGLEQHRHDTAPTQQPLAEHDLQVHLAVLKKDPRNRQALVQAGNICYDGQRYAEAITYYTRGLEIDPNDVNVRTDLGTAYWYSGKAEEAVRQFELALKLVPTYPQTLFNLGIVRLHGLNDPEGAVAAWEKLLASNPGYPEAGKVRAQLEQARALLRLKKPG